MCITDDVDKRAVDSEAIRVRAKLGDLTSENRELLEDLVEGKAIAELARDYTSGDTRILHERLRIVLMRHLEFDPSIPMSEMIAALAIAFEHTNESIN